CQNNADCPTQTNRCVTTSSGKKCLPDNCGGALCQEDANCESLDTQCNYCQQCVPGGDTGIPCSLDTDCSYTCNNNYQCAFGGGGGICNPFIADDCASQHFKCNEDRQCVLGDDGGASCDPESEDPCPQELEKRCNDYLQCVPGGEGRPCEYHRDCRGNEPPSANNLVAGPGSYCSGVDGAGLAVFQWDYSDFENDPQTKFWFEIDNNSDFSSPEVARTGATSNEQLILVQIPLSTELSDYINYNTSYYWRVKVQANANGFLQESEWAYYRDGETYTYDYNHPAPSPIYSITPKPIAPGGTAIFSNNSRCYNNSGNLTPCASYLWDFGDGATSQIKDPPSHAYDGARTTGKYSTSLQACDEVSCCVAGVDLPIKAGGPNDLPNWKEISPF
ncbi:MAG: hypothetical protein AAB925_02015, partial [Patescibacteria group bacterium]